MAVFINSLQEGSTVFLRPGYYQTNIRTIDSNIYERVHIRGAGVNLTFIMGYVWMGAGSSIKNLTIDNRQATPEETTVAAIPNGITMENMVVNGGRNGLLTQAR